MNYTRHDSLTQLLDKVQPWRGVPQTAMRRLPAPPTNIDLMDTIIEDDERETMIQARLFSPQVVSGPLTRGVVVQLREAQEQLATVMSTQRKVQTQCAKLAEDVIILKQERDKAIEQVSQPGPPRPNYRWLIVGGARVYLYRLCFPVARSLLRGRSLKAWKLKMPSFSTTWNALGRSGRSSLGGRRTQRRAEIPPWRKWLNSKKREILRWTLQTRPPRKTRLPLCIGMQLCRRCARDVPQQAVGLHLQ